MTSRGTLDFESLTEGLCFTDPSNVMSAPYFSQSSASKAYISIVDADLSAMIVGWL